MAYPIVYFADLLQRSDALCVQVPILVEKDYGYGCIIPYEVTRYLESGGILTVRTGHYCWFQESVWYSAINLHGQSVQRAQINVL